MRNLAVLLALLTCSPLCWQPLRGQPPSVGVEAGHNQKQDGKLTGPEAQADQRGTKDAPLIVETQNRPKTDQEAKEEKKSTERKDYMDTWTLRTAFFVAGCTGLLVVVGGFGVYAAVRTLRAIEKQAGYMKESLEETRKALIVSEGPQVQFVSAKVTNTTTDLFVGHKVCVEVEIRNFGHLAAENVSIGACVDIRQDDPLPINVPEQYSGVGLPPGIPLVMKFYSPELLTSFEIADVMTGVKFLRVSGVIASSSPLEPLLTKYTVFCSVYDPSREDRVFVGSGVAPQLLIDGKPLERTHDPQQRPN